jgi:hypothetical protein
MHVVASRLFGILPLPVWSVPMDLAVLRGYLMLASREAPPIRQ